MSRRQDDDSTTSVYFPIQKCSRVPRPRFLSQVTEPDPRSCTIVP
ncbi:nonsense-mediated mrna decay protein, partial [Moniliophthora roreri]